MTEEERILSGVLFSPGDSELKAMKLRSHKLSRMYSQLPEEEQEERQKLLRELVGSIGENSNIQGPVFFSLWCSYQNWEWIFLGIII